MKLDALLLLSSGVVRGLAVSRQTNAYYPRDLIPSASKLSSATPVPTGLSSVYTSLNLTDTDTDTDSDWDTDDEGDSNLCAAKFLDCGDYGKNVTASSGPPVITPWKGFSIQPHPLPDLYELLMKKNTTYVSYENATQSNYKLRTSTGIYDSDAIHNFVVDQPIPPKLIGELLQSLTKNNKTLRKLIEQSWHAPITEKGKKRLKELFSWSQAAIDAAKSNITFNDVFFHTLGSSINTEPTIVAVNEIKYIKDALLKGSGSLNLSKRVTSALGYIPHVPMLRLLSKLTKEPFDKTDYVLHENRQYVQDRIDEARQVTVQTTKLLDQMQELTDYPMQFNLGRNRGYEDPLAELVIRRFQGTADYSDLRYFVKSRLAVLTENLKKVTDLTPEKQREQLKTDHKQMLKMIKSDIKNGKKEIKSEKEQIQRTKKEQKKILKEIRKGNLQVRPDGKNIELDRKMRYLQDAETRLEKAKESVRQWKRQYRENKVGSRARDRWITKMQGEMQKERAELNKPIQKVELEWETPKERAQREDAEHAALTAKFAAEKAETSKSGTMGDNKAPTEAEPPGAVKPGDVSDPQSVKLEGSPEPAGLDNLDKPLEIPSVPGPKLGGKPA